MVLTPAQLALLLEANGLAPNGGAGAAPPSGSGVMENCSATGSNGLAARI